MKPKLFWIAGVIVSIAASVEAADRMSKEFDVGDYPKLIVEADAAHVEVNKGTAGMIKISVKVPDREDFRVSTSQSGDKIRIKLEHKGLMGWLAFPLHAIDEDAVVISAEVPSKCDLDISTDAGRIDVTEVSGIVEVTTTSGVIELEDVGNEVRVSSSNGSIKVDKLTGKLDADVNAGSIKLGNSTGSFDLESNTGRIEVRNSSGKFRAYSNVGNIDFEGTITEGEDNLFSSDVGSVKVTLSEQKDLEIEAETDLGDVSIYPKPTKVISKGERYLNAMLGVGGPKLRIRSDVGSIDIEKGSIMTRGDEENGEDNGEKPEPEPIPETPPETPTPGIKPPTGK
ncbi:DUF4097 family beta strand repeat protein [candidate division WOR-3 bacterium]|nr:DUF4097 family beta strand repeat protein [candidate division WOR-3 bacterium]